MSLNLAINILQNATLPIIYGVIGLLVAVKHGEKVKVSLFAKTVLISLLTAGGISQLRFDQVTQIVFTTGLAEAIGELVNLKMVKPGV